jgi:hypothetical protein
MPVDPILSALPALANLIGTTGRPESAPVRAQVLNLPAQLAGAPTPVSISGIVAESPIPGQLRIATAVGDVQLHTPTELPPGRAVTIVTRPNVPTEVFLLPNAAPAALPQAKPTPNAPPQAGAPTQTGGPVQTGMPIQAGSTPHQVATGPQSAPRLQGSPAQPLPPANTAQPFGVPSAATPAGQGTVAAAPPPANPATPQAPVAVDARGNPVPVQRAALPPAPAPHAPTLSPASLLATFEAAVMPERASATAYATPAMAAPPSDLLALLTDLRRLVAARDPKAADRLLRRLPTPDRGGALALLTLPVAARRDELATWIGRDIARLVQEEPDDSKADLVERLTAALTQTEERLDDSGERTWRWRPLPMADNGQLVPMQLGVAAERTQPDASGGDGKRRPLRIFEFAVEAALSALGLTRVEATYHQRRLDLVVQCETPIEQEGREQIVAAVGRVFEEFGLGGSCRFEPYRAAAGAAGPIKI